MGASFLRAAWLIPNKMARWQRIAAAHIKRQVPRVKDVVWIFSSGTQSVNRVKCIGLSHEAIFESAKAVNAHLQSTAKDIWSVEIPTYHVGGFSIFARAHLSGAKVVQGGKWDAVKFGKRVKDKKITLTSLVPTQVFDLVAAKVLAPKNLRAVVVGGGALDSHLYAQARALGWPLLPSYGLTECGSQVATAPLESLIIKEFPGLTVLPHVRVDFRHQRIFLQCLSACRWIATAGEDGEFTLEDPLRDGWFATEDLGEWKGVPIAGQPLQVRILGRQDDVVKIFGVLVSVPQVESDLREFCRKRNLTMNAEFTLVAAGSEREGSRIIAVTTSKQALGSIEAIIKSYNASVNGPYRIHQTRWLSQIPRTALGKVKKAELWSSLSIG